MHRPYTLPAVRGVTMVVRCMIRRSPHCLPSSHVRPASSSRRSQVLRAKRNPRGQLRAVTRVCGSGGAGIPMALGAALRLAHVWGGLPSAREPPAATKDDRGPLRAKKDDREPRVAETTLADHLHHSEAGDYLEAGPFGLAMGEEEEEEAEEGVPPPAPKDPQQDEAAAAAAARLHDADEATGYGEAMGMETPSPALHDLYVDLFDSEAGRERRLVDSRCGEINVRLCVAVCRR